MRNEPNSLSWCASLSERVRLTSQFHDRDGVGRKYGSDELKIDEAKPNFLGKVWGFWKNKPKSKPKVLSRAADTGAGGFNDVQGFVGPGQDAFGGLVLAIEETRDADRQPDGWIHSQGGGHRVDQGGKTLGQLRGAFRG